jgi:hypothetical protein
MGGGGATIIDSERRGVTPVRGRDFSKLLPGPRSASVEELDRQQGVRPVTSLDGMRADLCESDEELEDSLAGVRASRQADLG